MSKGFGRQYTERTAALIVPLLFIMTGQVGWMVAIAVLLTNRSAFMAGDWGNERLIASTHLFTLGFVTMTIIGVLFQLIPVTFNVAPRRLAQVAIVFGMWVLGVGVFAVGFSLADRMLIGIGAGLVVATLTAFLVSVVRLLQWAHHHPFHSPFIHSGLGYLGVTIVLGGLLAWNKVQSLGLPHGLLLSHIAVAAGGFVGLILIGLSYKLSVMFFPVKADPLHSRAVFWAMHGAVLSELVGGVVHFGLQLIGGLGFVIGVLLYGWDMATFWMGRRNRAHDPALYLTAAGIVALEAGLIVSLGYLVDPQSHNLAAIIFLVFNGWFGMSIAGYSQKILPFLLWLHRYGHRHGQGKVPRMNDIFRPSWSWQIFCLMGIGMGISAGSLIAEQAEGLEVGLAVLEAAVLRLHIASWQAILGTPKSIS